MLSLTDPNVKREIIMDHYENPRNKKEINDPRYISTNMNSESCIDDITIYLLIKDNIIIDFKFSGIGCAISTASTSILSELVTNKTITEALDIVNEFDKMIKEEPFDELKLEEAIVFKDVSKQANRIKCAMIGYTGLTRLLETLK